MANETEELTAPTTGDAPVAESTAPVDGAAPKGAPPDARVVKAATGVTATGFAMQEVVQAAAAKETAVKGADHSTAQALDVAVSQTVERNKDQFAALSVLDKEGMPDILRLAAKRSRSLLENGGLEGAPVSNADWLSAASRKRFQLLNNGSEDTAVLMARQKAGQTTPYEDAILFQANTIATQRQGTFPDFGPQANDYVRFATKWTREFDNTYGQDIAPQMKIALTDIATHGFLAGSNDVARNNAVMQIFQASKLGGTDRNKQAEMMTAVVRGLDGAYKGGMKDDKGNVIPNSGFAALAETGAAGMIIEELVNHSRSEINATTVRETVERAASNFMGLAGGRLQVSEAEHHLLAEIATFKAIKIPQRHGSLSDRAERYISAENAKNWAAETMRADTDTHDNITIGVLKSVSDGVGSTLQQLAVDGMVLPEGMTYQEAIKGWVKSDSKVTNRFLPEQQARLRYAVSESTQESRRRIEEQFPVDSETAMLLTLGVTVGTSAAALTNAKTLVDSVDNWNRGSLLSDGKLNPAQTAAVAGQMLSPVNGANVSFSDDPEENRKIRETVAAIKSRQEGVKDPVSEKQQYIRDVKIPRMLEIIESDPEWGNLESQWALAAGDPAEQARIIAKRDKKLVEAYASLPDKDPSDFVETEVGAVAAKARFAKENEGYDQRIAALQQEIDEAKDPEKQAAPNPRLLKADADIEQEKAAIDAGPPDAPRRRIVLQHLIQVRESIAQADTAREKARVSNLSADLEKLKDKKSRLAADLTKPRAIAGQHNPLLFKSIERNEGRDHARRLVEQLTTAPSTPSTNKNLGSAADIDKRIADLTKYMETGDIGSNSTVLKNKLDKLLAARAEIDSAADGSAEPPKTGAPAATTLPMFGASVVARFGDILINAATPGIFRERRQKERYDPAVLAADVKTLQNYQAMAAKQAADTSRALGVKFANAGYNPAVVKEAYSKLDVIRKGDSLDQIRTRAEAAMQMYIKNNESKLTPAQLVAASATIDEIKVSKDPTMLLGILYNYEEGIRKQALRNKLDEVGAVAEVKLKAKGGSGSVPEAPDTAGEV